MNTFLIAEIILVHCKNAENTNLMFITTLNILIFLLPDIFYKYRDIYIHNINIQTHMQISSLLSFVKYSYIGKEHYRQKKE